MKIFLKRLSTLLCSCLPFSGIEEPISFANIYSEINIQASKSTALRFWTKNMEETLPKLAVPNCERSISLDVHFRRFALCLCHPSFQIPLHSISAWQAAPLQGLRFSQCLVSGFFHQQTKHLQAIQHIKEPPCMDSDRKCKTKLT